MLLATESTVLCDGKMDIGDRKLLLTAYKIKLNLMFALNELHLNYIPVN